MRFNPGGTIALGVVLTLLWAALSGGDDWAFGVVAIVAVILVSQLLVPLPALGISLPGLARFLAFFLRGSLVGGVDVSRRALSPGLPLDVHRYWHTLALPPGAPRVVLVGAISLLPGTLSVRLHDETLLIHSIAGDPARTIVQLEERVGGLFGLTDAGGNRKGAADG
ncbi:MAG: Na+/H+ antiporter subunit E [Halofilum sp. (in: g-proteobacteria)]|nr:Na+/H+ antiporter subunit E [Halofilum sp. (in: g-proteobacteria)]